MFLYTKHAHMYSTSVAGAKATCANCPHAHTYKFYSMLCNLSRGVLRSRSLGRVLEVLEAVVEES
jgi:hypothetical protein